MPTLAQLLGRYVDARIQIKAQTVIEYRGTINWFSEWLGRPATPDDLTDEMVTSFLRAVSQIRSIATAAKHRRQIMLLWAWAWRKGHASHAPRDVPTIRVPKRRPRAWTPGEVAKILEACRSARSIPGWGPERWEALALSIYDTGERISPLFQLPIDAFDRRKQVLFVDAEYRKRGTEDQCYRLHPQTVDSITASLSPGQSKLFPWPLHERSLWPAWKRILGAAGLPATSKDLFHKLRRTNYTQVYIALGRDAARRNAGHSRDLTHLYLDESQVPLQPICDAIRRPG